MIAYDSSAEMIKHFRVDKMLNIEANGRSREGKHEFKAFDMAAYARKMFGMYAGKEEWVSIECDNSYSGIMIDRFGKDVAMRKIDENTIQARVNVAVSRQFFGWLAGLGAAVQIESPEPVAREYREYLETILKTYGEQEL